MIRRLWERINSSSIAYRYSHGAFWSLIGGVTYRVLALAASVVVARVLGRELFGELAIIQSTTNLFGAFAGFGFGTTAAKFIAELRVKDRARAGRILALSWLAAWVVGGAMALLLFVTAPWLAEHALAAPRLAPPMRIGAVMICISAVHSVQTGALAGFEAFKETALINLITGVSTLPLMVAGVYWGGLDGAVWGLVLSMVVSFIASNRAIAAQSRRVGVAAAFGGCLRERKVLWGFSLPAMISGMLINPVNWLCSAMLVNRENGYVQMGLFNAANQWFGALLFVPTVLGYVLTPMLSERRGAKDHHRVGRIFWTAIGLNLAVILPLVLIGCIASRFIMGLYGHNFASGWPTLVVVLLTAAIVAAQAPVANLIAASERMWTGCAMNVGWAVVFVGATLALISWGALGLAAGRCIAYLGQAVWAISFGYILVKKGRSLARPSDLTQAPDGP